MKNLEDYGVQTLESEEVNKTNGGGNGIGTVLAIIGAGIYVYNNWDDFVEGVKEGYASTQ